MAKTPEQMEQMAVEREASLLLWRTDRSQWYHEYVGKLRNMIRWAISYSQDITTPLKMTSMQIQFIATDLADQVLDHYEKYVETCFADTLIAAEKKEAESLQVWAGIELEKARIASKNGKKETSQVVDTETQT